ncbi:hypothetical protein M899_1506 [Bacteriovorax sp. BSW11_IV]|uniref:hypothetical protein n=1 Tax=Bacteriovorax sp. BSW11_IV TaxID=1353529 RepID=UPI000389EDE5|nr:hypothetical protein [Bacteriovorax sp. BSW11_IV]EQC48318.1 hypothetical protein M899_1506 [Bacteriovorax sp. BSW11_IV]
MRKLFITLIALASFQASADAYKAWDILVKSKGNIKYYPQVVNHLVEGQLYFTSVPYIKEYMYQHEGKLDKKFDLVIDEVITKVGVKQFEILPSKALEQSSSPVVKYILAKKNFRYGKYKETLAYLNGTIPKEHPVKPFALFLEAAVFSINKKYKSSITAYEECIDVSERRISSENDFERIRQLKVNRDYCIVGKARALFAWGKNTEANLAYLDLPKSSYIWPEILFEEAWNSFYLKDYNRTLGKLVTYKAPVLNYMFNAEIEVLRGLTYMELCLWNDVKNVVDGFYSKYESDSLSLKKLIREKGKDYKYFYLLAKSSREGKVRGNDLLATLMNYINRDPAYIELFEAFQNGNSEIQKTSSMNSKGMKRVFSQNLREALLTQRNLVGAYVRKSLINALKQIDNSFESMSYMKLEVLAQRKRELYLDVRKDEKRGDIAYLQRTDKQYFWSFNGEFWADELGDYVFSLKSECSE